MKQLTKLTTSLLCLVMMFCFSSCTEEETTDVVIPDVSASTISTLVAGNAKIQIEWLVPSDANITTCTVTITDSDKVVVKSLDYSVMPGENVTETIDGLEAGKYTVSVLNSGKSAMNTEAVSSTVTVYDASTYTTQPTVGTMSIDATTGYITIPFTTIPTDGVGVEIAYTDFGGVARTTGYVELVSGGSIILTDAKSGTEFFLTTYFWPTDGLDAVLLTYDTELFLPEATPSAPTNVMGQSGEGTISLSWYISEDSGDVVGSIITYTDADGNATTTDVIEVTVGKTNTYALSNLAVGTYTVTIVNVLAGGTQSSSTSAGDFVVYNSASYTTLPDATILTDPDTGAVSIEWSNIPDDCQGVKITYIDENGASVTTDLIVISESAATIGFYSSIKYGTNLSFVAYFMPDGGMSSVALYSPEYYISVIPPVAPTSVSVASSVDSENNPVINVTWSVAETGAVPAASAIIYYTTEGTTYELPVADVTAAGNPNTATISADLVAGKEYSVEVVSVGSEDNGAAVSVATAATSTVTTYGADTYASTPLVWSAIINNLDFKATIQWENKTLTDLYQVDVTYYISDTETTTVTDTDLSSIYTVIEGAVSGTKFTYTAYFKPSYGDEPVKIVNSDDTNIIELVDDTKPTPITVTAGDRKLYVAWNPGYNVNVVSSIIVYEGSSITYESAAIPVTLGVENTTVISDVNAGSYNVYIKNVLSDGSESYADDNQTVSVTVYAPITYTTLPTVSGFIMGTNVEFEFSSIPSDLYSVTVTYNAVETTFTAEDISAGTDLSVVYVDGVYDYTYTADFKPADGYDAATSITTGSGTAGLVDIMYDGTTYNIYTAKGLAAFGDLVNGTTVHSDAGVSGTGAASFGTSNLSINGKLGADINLSTICSETSTTNWTPIGNDLAIYTGTFDGNGKTISNMYISTAASYQGLFGYIGSGATIKDLTLDNPQITIAADDTKYSYVAAIVGCLESSTLSGCTTSGDSGFVKALNTGTDTALGSTFVAGVAGSVNIGTLIDCHNKIIVINNATSSTSNDAGVGGITASSFGASLYVYCSNTADVTGCMNNVGGLAGVERAGTVIGCWNTATIYGNGAYLSGLIGGGANASSTQVVGCYNTGDLRNAEGCTGTTLSGGIIGRTSTTAGVYGCYNTGGIYLSAVTTTGYISAYGIGGNIAAIENCYYVDVDEEGDILSKGAGNGTDPTTSTDLTTLNSDAVTIMNTSVAAKIADLGLSYSVKFESGTTTPIIVME